MKTILVISAVILLAIFILTSCETIEERSPSRRSATTTTTAPVTGTTVETQTTRAF